MKYNQIQHILHYWIIFDAIKKLLNNKEIFKYCIFDYILKYTTNNKDKEEKYYRSNIIMSDDVIYKHQLI